MPPTCPARSSACFHSSSNCRGAGQLRDHAVIFVGVPIINVLGDHLDGPASGAEQPLGLLESFETAELDFKC